MTDYRDYGRQVADARRRRGWTQVDLAERIGVDASTISRIEHGRVRRLTHLVAEGIERLLGVAPPAVEMGSSLERAWETYWRQLAPPSAPPYETQYLVLPGRRWRFDVAWPSYRVAVELHGGEWNGGRHVRGGGFIGDREKINAAQTAGWIVLEFSGTMLHRDPAACIDQVLTALRSRGVEVT